VNYVVIYQGYNS